MTDDDLAVLAAFARLRRARAAFTVAGARVTRQQEEQKVANQAQDDAFAELQEAREALYGLAVPKGDG